MNDITEQVEFELEKLGQNISTLSYIITKIEATTVATEKINSSVNELTQENENLVKTVNKNISLIVNKSKNLQNIVKQDYNKLSFDMKTLFEKQEKALNEYSNLTKTISSIDFLDRFEKLDTSLDTSFQQGQETLNKLDFLQVMNAKILENGANINSLKQELNTLIQNQIESLTEIISSIDFLNRFEKLDTSLDTSLQQGQAILNELNFFQVLNTQIIKNESNIIYLKQELNTLIKDQNEYWITQQKENKKFFILFILILVILLVCMGTVLWLAINK